MIVAVTGHRPDKLGGYRVPNPVFNSVMEGLDRALLQLRPEYVITGMAIGVDQWMAELCIFNGIPFIAAVPFEGQESRWPAYSQVKYHQILRQASQVVRVCNGEYASWKMQRRNEWMVDQAELMVAVFDGTPGGTANCLAYATRVGKPIHYVEFSAPAPVLPAVREVQVVPLEPNAVADQIATEAVRELLEEETEGRRHLRRQAQLAAEQEVEEPPSPPPRPVPFGPVPFPREEDKKEETAPAIPAYGRFVDLS